MVGASGRKKMNGGEKKEIEPSNWKMNKKSIITDRLIL